MPRPPFGPEAEIPSGLDRLRRAQYRIFMPKQPISVTIGQDNMLWLKGRVVGGKRKSISEALDELVTAARRGGCAASERRTVVGTVDIAGDDPSLENADAHIRSVFDASLARPLVVREGPASASGYGRSVRTSAAGKAKRARKPGRG